MPDVAAFRTQFPEPLFASDDDADVALALSEAMCLHNQNDLATLYCTAHLLALNHERTDARGNVIAGPDGGSGVVVSEKIGPRQIEYMTTAGEDERRAFFATTSWGRRFLELEARTPRVAMGMITA